MNRVGDWLSAAPASGFSPGGLPYARRGHGPRPLVVFLGLTFHNTPQAARIVRLYEPLGEAYTLYGVLRRPGLPPEATLADMAGDYAAFIGDTFGGPVDVLGSSTGGSIAHHFAANHPGLVRKLVLHSSAYTLGESARRLQRLAAELAAAGRWREANAAMLEMVLPPSGAAHALRRPLTWLGSWLMTALDRPGDPNDLIVTVAAEDRFDFRDRLGQIAAPTLVIAGEDDPCYSAALFRETAAGIPYARLILYPGQGHTAAGAQFTRDVLAFLGEP